MAIEHEVYELDVRTSFWIHWNMLYQVAASHYAYLEILKAQFVCLFFVIVVVVVLSFSQLFFHFVFIVEETKRTAVATKTTTEKGGRCKKKKRGGRRTKEVWAGWWGVNAGLLTVRETVSNVID